MLNITRFTFNNFEENTFLAVDKDTKQCAVIDPGMLTSEEKLFFDNYIIENGLTLTQVILTHSHLDHCFGANYVKTRYGVPIKAHKDEEAAAANVHLQTMRFGMFNVMDRGVELDVKLKDGDRIELGNSCFTVLHVPGHSPGGIVLYDEVDGVAFVGDSIFQGSIGRTDLPGGDYATLIDSLKTKILNLPDKTVLLSGHGDPTTVANERASNPFLK